MLYLKREGLYLNNKKKIDQKKAYMWPQLNIEELIKRNMFLVFLNSRG